MVIEKKYKSYDELNDFVAANTPEWMDIVRGDGGTISTSGYSSKYSKYGISHSGGFSVIYLPDDEDSPKGADYIPAITIGSLNKNTNVDLRITNMNRSYDSNISNKCYSGIARLVITGHAFGLSLLSTGYLVLAGAAIAYNDRVSDEKKYMTFLGTTNTSTSDGIYYLNALGTIDTNCKLSCAARTFTNDNVIVPYCDWQHGFTEPYEDVYIGVTRTSDLPTILSDGENTYYRITTSGDYDSPPIYIREKG